MSRFATLFDRRSFPIAVAALLSLLASACPFSDNYVIDNDGSDDAEGGAAGTGGTGGVSVPMTSTTTSSMATVGGAGGESCGAPETPPGGACPAECDSCARATCLMACGPEPEEKCDGDVLVCPAGFDCEIQCVGKDACKDASVMCPMGYGCHVSCDFDESCKSTAILCGGGECAVECNSPEACKEADFACAAQGFCSCTGFAQPLQTSGCDTACSCTGCE